MSTKRGPRSGCGAPIARSGRVGVTVVALFLAGCGAARDSQSTKNNDGLPFGGGPVAVEWSVAPDGGGADALAGCRRIIASGTREKSSSTLDWRRVYSGVLNLGFDSRPHWLRLRFAAGAAPDFFDRFVVFQQQMVAEVVYCAGDDIQSAGAAVPVLRWPQKLRYPAFRLNPAFDSPDALNEKRRPGVYYFRVRSDRILNFPLRVFFSLEEYLDFIQRRQIAQFSLLAVAALATVFYFGWSVATGRLMYSYFAALLFAVTLNFFIVYGDAYIYLWPHSPPFQKFAVKFTTALAALFAALFSRPLLRSFELPRLDAGIRVVIVVQVVSVLCAFFPALASVNTVIMFATPFAALGLILPAAWIQLRSGQLPARLYLSGWLIILVAFVLNASNFLGWTAYNAFFVNAPVLAAPLALLCFAIGSYRRGQAESRAAARLRERYAELARRLQESVPNPSGGIDRAGNPGASRTAQSQLRGVDIAEKKRRLLDTMRVERLYEVEDLRLEGLASQVGLRSHQLSELLNQELNISFSDFVRKFRIDAACEKLADPDNSEPALQIGLSVGFGSKTAFNRSFAELTGMTPGRYRSQARQSHRSGR